MKLSHGIDIVSVRRIRKSITQGRSAFLDRVYTKKEQAYCRPRARRFEHYAARFAAKEALMKALGDRVSSLAFRQIEVCSTPSGKPVIRLTPALRKKAGLTPGVRVELSLSHDSDYAVASVIIHS